MPASELEPPGEGGVHLPLTVSAVHLEWCAAELAASFPRPIRPGELAEIVEHLVAGQRDLAVAVARFAGRVGGARRSGSLAAVPDADTLALMEVLRSAALALDCSADALEESAPVLESVCENAVEDTRL